MIANRTRTAHGVGKPIMMAEFGWPWNQSPQTGLPQSLVYQDWLSVVQDAGMDLVPLIIMNLSPAINSDTPLLVFVFIEMFR